MPGGAERLLWEVFRKEIQALEGLWTCTLDLYNRPRTDSTPPPPPPPPAHFLLYEVPIVHGPNGKSTVIFMGPNGEARALEYAEPWYFTPAPVFSAPTQDAVAGGRLRACDFTVPSFFSKEVLDLSGAPTAPGRGWSVEKEDDDALYLKVAMPGLGKEHVKVSAEKNCVLIEVEGEKESWDGDKGDAAAAAAVPKHSRRIELTADAFKMDKIKAEMKNGVLRVTVPKVKKEERKDVFQVTIE